MQNHRLNIPTLLMADIIDGFRTIFPIPLALGSTWDEAAVEKMAEDSAKGAAVSGLHVTFSPMVDLVRNHRYVGDVSWSQQAKIHYSTAALSCCNG